MVLFGLVFVLATLASADDGKNLLAAKIFAEKARDGDAPLEAVEDENDTAEDETAVENDEESDE